MHPAIPWHLNRLFQQHYGPPGSPTAQHATHAWTTAISDLGNYWHDRYGQGHANVIGMLAGEEDNLLRARQLARDNGWWDLVIGPMQGLQHPLRSHRADRWNGAGSSPSWSPTSPTRPPAAPSPAAKRNGPSSPNYRVAIAEDTRDWPTAQHLQDARITWRRQQARPPR